MGVYSDPSTSRMKSGPPAETAVGVRLLNRRRRRANLRKQLNAEKKEDNERGEYQTEFLPLERPPFAGHLRFVLSLV